MAELCVGIQGTCRVEVTNDLSAKSIKSGTLDVLATPAVVALAEECAWKSVQPYLENGLGTVGISVDMKHIAPTPVGREVVCRTELTHLEGRKMTFSFRVSDSVQEIAFGTHNRFIVNEDEFMAKAVK